MVNSQTADKLSQKLEKCQPLNRAVAIPRPEKCNVASRYGNVRWKSYTPIWNAFISY
jgi:hypothetical protein